VITAMLMGAERYETYNQPEAPIPIGPHLEFHGLSESAAGDADAVAFTAHFGNVSDIAVVGYQLLDSFVVTVHGSNSNNPDVVAATEALEQKAQSITVHKVSTLQITPGVGIGMPPTNISRSDLLAAQNGKKGMFFVAIALYVADNTPRGQRWITETCALVVGIPHKFQACSRFNRYFLAEQAPLPAN
jgi:hypothetical protein